jgi:hypothetical protein
MIKAILCIAGWVVIVAIICAIIRYDRKKYGPMALALVVLMIAITALADGYTIYRPGELPIQVERNVGGGYTVYEPGKLPQTITPSGNGGYTVNTPGELPTQIQPNPPTIISPEPLYQPLKPLGR